jgi:hypothetical protein
MQLTLFDWILAAAAAGAALHAVQRGLGKELLHTFLLLIGITAGVFYLHDKAQPTDGAAVAARFVNLGWYLLGLYVLAWVFIRTFGMVFIGDYYGGWRTKFWGGILALTKVICLVLGFMVAYAVASPLPSPDRLLVLPHMIAESSLMNIADVESDGMYKALVAGGWVSDANKLPTAVTAPADEQPSATTLPPVSGTAHLVDDLPVSGSAPH